MKKLAVFVSGSGTNLENLARRIRKHQVKNCRIALVVSDKPGALALVRARKYGLETLVVDRSQYGSKAGFEKAILGSLKKKKIDWVVLAGFMRILGTGFVKAYRWKIVNIHPALLPCFPGAHAISDAWQAKVKETGITVHFVDEGVDTGPVILQKRILVQRGETLESLEKRIHALEYQWYPKAIQWLVNGLLDVRDGKVVKKGEPPQESRAKRRKER